MIREWQSSNPEMTESFGKETASLLEAGDVLLLEGELAAGKTLFTRGLVAGLGGDPAEVSSPTFVILQSYSCEAPIDIVHHLDLYRLRDESLLEIGLEEILAEERSLTVVEWPDERLFGLISRTQRVLRLRISVNKDGLRHLVLEAV